MVDQSVCPESVSWLVGWLVGWFVSLYELRSNDATVTTMLTTGNTHTHTKLAISQQVGLCTNIKCRPLAECADMTLNC